MAAFGFASLSHGALREADGATVGELVIWGQGDPPLQTADLATCQRPGRSGVRSPLGDILVDQSFFGWGVCAAGFEQQPNEWAYFRAPVSALALDRNTVTMFQAAGGEGRAGAGDHRSARICRHLRLAARQAQRIVRRTLRSSYRQTGASVRQDRRQHSEEADMIPFPRRRPHHAGPAPTRKRCGQCRAGHGAAAHIPSRWSARACWP